MLARAPDSFFAEPVQNARLVAHIDHVDLRYPVD